MQESQPLFEICEKRPSHWGPCSVDIDLNKTALFAGMFDYYIIHFTLISCNTILYIVSAIQFSKHLRVHYKMVIVDLLVSKLCC